MAEHNLHSSKATRDLKRAQKDYEASVSKKGKQIIEELQIEVDKASEGMDSKAISEEVDWISDPGTPTTRATQFLRTQSVAWQMKTLLAKAMSMQGAAFKEAYQANSLASAKNSARLDKLEISINSLTKELKMLAQSLGGFIRLFKMYMHHVLNVPVEIPEDDSKTTIIRRHRPRSVPKGDDGAGPSAAGSPGVGKIDQ